MSSLALLLNSEFEEVHCYSPITRGTAKIRAVYLEITNHVTTSPRHFGPQCNLCTLSFISGRQQRHLHQATEKFGPEQESNEHHTFKATTEHVESVPTRSSGRGGS